MILISPYSRKLRNGKENPKNYPYWKELITLINGEVIQLGVESEQKIEGVSDFYKDLPLDKLTDLVKECDIWISVDNFFPHLAHHVHMCTARVKPGIVLFGPSDPKVYGYPENINLSVGKLRKNQFEIWESCETIEDCFTKPEEVYGRFCERMGQ